MFERGIGELMGNGVDVVDGVIKGVGDIAGASVGSSADTGTSVEASNVDMASDVA